jgi:hypothetical protein
MRASSHGLSSARKMTAHSQRALGSVEYAKQQLSIPQRQLQHSPNGPPDALTVNPIVERLNHRASVQVSQHILLRPSARVTVTEGTTQSCPQFVLSHHARTFPAVIKDARVLRHPAPSRSVSDARPLRQDETTLFLLIDLADRPQPSGLELGGEPAHESEVTQAPHPGQAVPAPWVSAVVRLLVPSWRVPDCRRRHRGTG